jgi:hypothetical protein
MIEYQTQCFELANDGIHWSFMSMDAIEILIEVLLGSVEDTQPFWFGSFPIRCHWFIILLLPALLPTEAIATEIVALQSSITHLPAAGTLFRPQCWALRQKT